MVLTFVLLKQLSKYRTWRFYVAQYIFQCDTMSKPIKIQVNNNRRKKNSNNKNKKLEIDIKTKSGRNRGGRTRNRGRVYINRPPNPIQTLTQYTSATTDLINLVCNPIHCEVPARFTDNYDGESLVLYDAFNELQGLTIGISSETTPGNATAFMFVQVYGPIPILTSQSLPYGLYALPISDTTDKPIPENSTTNIFPFYESDNRALIINASDTATALADEIRMVSMGFRINPLVDLNVGQQTVFVSRFIGGQIRINDLEHLCDPNYAAYFSTMILNRPKHEYQSAAGVSGRYNPFQMETLTEFWPWSTLVYDQSYQALNSPLNINKVTYPYCVVEMNGPVTPTEVETGIWQYDIPVKLEAKWWIESVLKLPTPIIMTMSPKDINFNSLGFSMAKYPLVSNGCSFHNVVRKGIKAGKFIGKNLRAKNIRKAGRYVGGLARASKVAMSDIQQSLMN